MLPVSLLVNGTEVVSYSVLVTPGKRRNELPPYPHIYHSLALSLSSVFLTGVFLPTA
jgi:hypothetical protein